MKTFVKLIFWFGFLFYGGGIVVALLQFTVYNGFGDIFEYVKPEHLETWVKIDSIDESIIISYKYVVDKKAYESKQSIPLSKVSKNNFSEDNIYYNKQIPYFSYIGNPYLAQRKVKIVMCACTIPFLFFFLLYKFADMDRCWRIYRRRI